MKRRNGKAAAPIYCGRVAYGPLVELRRRVDTTTGEAESYAAGLQTCGSLWACPVCSAAIRDGRARQLQAAIGEHLARGGGLYMLTLTTRHRLGDDLGALIEALNVGWTRAAASSRQARDWRDRLGWVGAVRALEVTYGANGWHPHLHVLIFTERPLSTDVQGAYGAWLSWAWAGQMRKILGVTLSAEHGVRLDPVRTTDEAGNYLAKVQDDNGAEVEVDVAAELLRGDMKQARRNRNGKGLVPFQLLDLIEDADPTVHERAVWLWREYERATCRRRCITGLTPILERYGIADVDDQTLAEEPPLDDVPDVVDEWVAWIDPATWLNVCRFGLDYAALDAAEDGGAAAVDRVLDEARLLATAAGPPGGVDDGGGYEPANV